MPSFVAKIEAKSYPGIGTIACAIQSQFLLRSDTKEKRSQSLQMITERQIEGEKGLYPVLNIFPEGCCTNGTKLIKFKKGAFCSLRAVAPLVIKYKTPKFGLDPQQDIVGFFAM